MIAFLTIMGYSLYDTIVVYDKVRDVGGRLDPADTLQRDDEPLAQPDLDAVDQHVDHLGPAGGIDAGDRLALPRALTLREFAIALLIGILVGTYSSIFVAASVVAYMKEREAENRATAAKVQARSGDTGTRRVSDEDVTLAEPGVRWSGGSDSPAEQFEPGAVRWWRQPASGPGPGGSAFGRRQTHGFVGSARSAAQAKRRSPDSGTIG